MKIKEILHNLDYVNSFKSKRQTYYIYKSKKYYLLLTLSLKKENAGNFTLVSLKAIDSVYRKFKGKKAVTSNDIFRSSKNKSYHRYIKSALDALNVLYVLAVIGRAGKDNRFKGKQLYFNIK